MNKNLISFSAIILIGAFYLSTIREGQQWGDAGQYLQHAKNIVEGNSYGASGYIFNPDFPWGPESYPPMYPLTLSLVYKFFGINLTLMKVEIIIFFLLALLVFSLLWREELQPCHLIALTLLIGLKPFFWDFKETLVSDIPFLFFSYLSLYFLNKCLAMAGLSRMQQLKYIILNAFILYLSFGTKVVGVVLFLTLIIYDILKTRKLTLFTVGVITISLFFITAQQLVVKSFPNYSYEFHFSFSAIFTNLILYGRALVLLWPKENRFVYIQIIFSLFLITIAFWGYFKTLRKQLTILEIYPLVYIASIMPLSVCGGQRYLIPMFPLYLFYILRGLEELPFGRKKLLSSTTIALIFLSYIVGYTEMNWGHIDGVTNNSSVELFNYVKSETDSTDVFIFTRPRSFSFHTERRSTIFPFTWEDDKIWEYFKKIKAGYVIVGSPHLTIGRLKAFGIDHQYIIPFIERYNNPTLKRGVMLVYSNQDFKLYKILSHNSH